MRFYYDEKSSERYQQLYFPLLCRPKDYILEKTGDPLEEGSEEEFKAILNSDKWVSQVATSLAPFEKEIEKYYLKSFFSLSLFTALMLAENFFNKQSLFAWLEALLGADDDFLRLQVVKKVYIHKEESLIADIDKTQEQALKALITNTSQWSAFLEEHLLTKEECWQVLQFLINPKGFIKGLHALHKNLEPFYKSQKERIEIAHAQGRALTKNLNENNGFLAVSFSLKEDNLYQEVAINGEVRILSVLVPSQININGSPPFMAVGYLISTVISLMQKVEKNKFKKQADVFKLLGDPTRYELLSHIAGGVTTTKELSERLSISGASVTYHLQALIEANLLHANWRRLALKDRINKEKVEATIGFLKKDLFEE